jgi:hypothetical protein
MSLNIGPFTLILLAVGFVGFLLNSYILIQIAPRPWMHGTTVLVLGMIIVWGVYLIFLGAAISADNPELGSEDFGGF